MTSVLDHVKHKSKIIIKKQTQTIMNICCIQNRYYTKYNFENQSPASPVKSLSKNKIFGFIFSHKRMLCANQTHKGLKEAI